jgi:drug/metabolite transporter (DMT)-like permease
MKRSVWLTFGALCLLSSSAWVVEPSGVSNLPSLERQGLLFFVVGLVALLLSGKGALLRIRQQSWERLAAAGLGFFGIPALAIEITSGSITETGRSALFAMVPIVVAVVLAAVEAGETAERGARRSLAPALVGLGGLLLLLPLNFSGSLRGNAMIAVVCIAVILIGIASVWSYPLLQEFELSDAIAVVCLSSAIFLLICGWASGAMVWNRSSLLSFLSSSSLVYITEVPLLLWLLRRMPPVQFASRYLLIPLLTILEAYILVRPPLTLRIGAGIILLATGTGMLLLQHSAENDVVSLR